MTNSTVIFQSRSMQRLLEQARQFARSSATVVLYGETGTGKELLARTLHQQGPRRSEPYVSVNCAALSQTLLESELFGHEAGAFTGAAARRVGRFEFVGTGTIFLDEIGELPCSAQPKLLRTLEEHEFQRVGGNDTLEFRGRLVAATHRNLAEEVQAGTFREDLFHRLNVLSLELPPLRERREDIPALVNYFVQQFQPELIRPVRGVTRDVMHRLCEYHWPGNIRELKNLMLRSCLLSEGPMIERIELPVVELRLTGDEEELPAPFDTLPLEDIERRIILHRLRRFQGNKTEAAAALGVTARTLRNKVTQYRRLGYVG